MVSYQSHAHINTVPSFAKISEQIFDYTSNITICWKTLLTSRMNCSKTKIAFKKENPDYLSSLRCNKRVFTGIITLNKLVLYFVMSFCQNTSSIIERVRNSRSEMLSSRTVLEHSKVLLCPSLVTPPADGNKEFLCWSTQVELYRIRIFGLESDRILCIFKGTGLDQISNFQFQTGSGSENLAQAIQ